MSKSFKIHKGFDIDDMTLEEEHCKCSSPSSGISIFSNITEAKTDFKNILENFNSTHNGQIFTEDDIVWEELKKSECEAWVDERI